MTENKMRVGCWTADFPTVAKCPFPKQDDGSRVCGHPRIAADEMLRIGSPLQNCVAPAECPLRVESIVIEVVAETRWRVSWKEGGRTRHGNQLDTWVLISYADTYAWWDGKPAPDGRCASFTTADHARWFAQAHGMPVVPEKVERAPEPTGPVL